MGTPYSAITDKFLRWVTDYDFLKFNEEERNEIILGLLHDACDEFANICVHDLYDRDDSQEIFNQELDAEEIVILSELMILFWLRPKYYNEQNMRNMMTRKEYTMYSPGNLLEKLTTLYNETKKSVYSRINRYSYVYKGEI